MTPRAPSWSNFFHFASPVWEILDPPLEFPNNSSNALLVVIVSKESTPDDVVVVIILSGVTTQS